MMSSENSAGYPYTAAPAPPKLRLTPEELAILKECNREGFYKRSVPCGLGLGCGAYCALKMGLLKPHIKYGAVPAIGLATLMGGLLGSFSYKTVCFQKLLALPNSTLRKQLEVYLHQQQPMLAESSPLSPEISELETDEQMNSGMQMESYHPTSSFDDFTGVDIDGYQASKPIDAVPRGNIAGPAVSYDDLRRRNREEYMHPPSSQPPPSRVNLPILPQTRKTEETTRFDRDRVPQYQLVD